MEYLPGYWFDPRTHNYHTRLASGRQQFVARAEVMRLLEAQVNAKEQLLSSITQQAIDGRLSPAVWQATMQQELKRLYLQNRALGAGGWDRLTAQDYGHIGGRLQSEYRHLRNMAQQIAAGEVSEAQALNRLRMYLGNARREYWLAERDHRRPTRADRMIIERRRLGIADHCKDCIRYAQMGWQPANVLPVPTEGSECGGNCRCTLDAKEIDAAEAGAWIGSKR